MDILSKLTRSLRLNVSAPNILEPRSLFAGSKFHLPILIILCAILFFWNIHVIPLTDGDSAFYAKIAKNIVETGDWLTMHYGDASSIIDKPPLMMWLTAASFKVFGVSDFAASFWHSLCALLIVIFTYQLAKELFDRRTAFLSSLVLISSAQFFYQARSPLQDIPLTLFTLLAVYAFILFEKTKKLGYFYLSPIFISLAVLTKGPVGLVLPAIILIAYVVINRTKLPGIHHMFLASILFLAITLPWFIFEYRLIGQKFFDVFISHNFGRYLKPVDTIGSEATKYAPIKSQYDFYSYFLQMFLLAIPWSGFIYPAVYYNIKKKINLLPVILALSVILFFSLSLNYKISRYILPAFPGLALITGKMLADLIEKEDPDAKRMAFISAVLTLILVTLPLLTLAFVLFYVRFTDVSGYYAPTLVGFLLPMTFALILGSVFIFIKKYRLSFLSLVIFACLSYLFLIYNLAAYYPALNPASRFCAKINGIAKPSDIVCQYRGTDAHFMIYYSKNNVTLIRNEGELKRLLLAKRKVFCVTESEGAFESLKASLKERIKVIDKSANFTLFTN